jgi:exopolysaccharide production protein ExoQ
LTASYQRLEPLHGVRKRRVDHHSRVTAWGSALVIFGALALEVHQPDIGIKLGNLIFMLACARVITLRCLLPPRTAAEVSSPSEYDLLIAFSLLWGAYSIVHSSSPEDSFVHTIFAGALWITILCVKSGRLDLTLRLIFWCGVAVASVALTLGQLQVGWAFQPVSSNGEPELRGFFEHQLKLGMLTGIVLGIVFIAFCNKELKSLMGRCPPILFGAAVAIVLVAFYESHARSPLGALVATLACCGSFAPRRAVRLATRAAVAAGIVVYWFHADEVSAMIFATESDLSFNGRTIIWEGTLEHAALNPWTGYGMASFGSPAFDSLWVHYRPLTAHNSYLQAYFETGYVGLALMVGLIAALIVRGVYTSLLWRRLSYTLFVALYGAFSSVMSVIYAGKPSMFLTLILLIAAQEAHATAQFRAASRGTQQSRFSRAAMAKPAAGTQ